MAAKATETVKPAPDVVSESNVATSQHASEHEVRTQLAAPDTDALAPPPPSHPEPTEVPPPFLGLRPGDQLFIGVMLIVSLMLMAAQWVRVSGWGLREVEIQRQPARVLEFRIDINKATWVEWSQLEGIGETLALRIVEDRDQHGPFKSIDDLLRVPGIGPKKLDAMRPWLTCEPQAQSAPPP